MPSKDWLSDPKNQERRRESRRKWYHNNKEKSCSKIKQRKKEIKEWFSNYKTNLKCEICSENHPATIQFHHIDPKEKELEISLAINNGWSINKILSEINKCQVLCANCHFKLHYYLAKGERFELPSQGFGDPHLTIRTTQEN